MADIVKYWTTLERKIIIAWIREPLSDANRGYRLESLARAFGLPLRYLERYCDPELEPCQGHYSSMGIYLAYEVIAWIHEHPDISPNEPTDDVTHWATMKLD